MQKHYTNIVTCTCSEIYINLGNSCILVYYWTTFLNGPRDHLKISFGLSRSHGRDVQALEILSQSWA